MKHANAGGSVPPFSKVMAAAMLTIGLGGCGGGGGGDGMLPSASSAPSDASTPTAQTTPTPETTPVPAPASRPVVDPFAPVAGSEAAPSLDRPQLGSTADVGNGSEGIYASLFGYTFVSHSGEVARKMLLGLVWGSVSVTGPNWMFDADTLEYDRSLSPVTGSGTFSRKVSMDGSYAVGGATATAWGPLFYSAANALAVTQASVAGTWSNSAEVGGIHMSIVVDATGAFTGRTSGASVGVCTVSGRLLLSQPGTAKNRYTMELSAVNAATAGEKACELEPLPYSGPSAIVLLPAGNFAGNGYFRGLSLLIRTANWANLSMVMRKV